MRLAIIRWAVAVVALSASGAVMAQSAACRQISGELKALGRGGGQAVQQAIAVRQQLQEATRALGQSGCQGGGLFGQQPAQCSGLRQQVQLLGGQLQQLDAMQRQNGGDTRRRQLEDAYAVNDCTGAGQIDNVRAIYDTEARRPRYATPILPEESTAPAPPPAQVANVEVDPRREGAIAICVRTCDGFFFPINFQGAEGQYSDICRASCPGAPAEMFWMRQGADLDSAISARGRRYTALPAAFRYRQRLDEACSCKASGASWGQTLARAEGLIRRKGDIVVTAETSERLANPEQLPLRGLRTDNELATASTAPVAEPQRRNSVQAEPFQPLPPRR